jgi:cellulose synthase/poly-beta-1,6-N-acetylglucosamine synthase-like glycosyltransferase
MIYEIIFWLLILIIFYTYLGYGVVIYMLALLRRKFFPRPLEVTTTSEFPEITLVVAAYNEEYIIEEKIRNCLELDYPESSLNLVIITDGSTDNTNSIVKRYSRVRIEFQPERKGKNHAVNRVLDDLNGDILVFTDANTMLNHSALKVMIRHFNTPEVGMVAGEKIVLSKKGQAAAQGEGLYWKYESWLKRLDSETGSTIGAAGELFAIRRELMEKVPPDILIEDFYQSLKVIQNGFRIVYEPEAYAIETGSATVGDELKRKVRISAGGLQAIFRLYSLLNLFKYGFVSFQYISHRVLRWTLTPLALPFAYLLNGFLLWQTQVEIYQVIWLGQNTLYLLALGGYLFSKSRFNFKITLTAYYFVVMNWSVYAGFLKLIRGKQSVVWAKANRQL